VWASTVFMLVGEAATQTRIALRTVRDSESDRTAGNQPSLGTLLRCMHRPLNRLPFKEGRVVFG
jgi:hypothetical protein